jgi:hypothetical protein
LIAPKPFCSSTDKLVLKQAETFLQIKELHRIGSMRTNAQSYTDFALYEEVDTLVTKDLTASLTYASYLEVLKKNGQSFKVFVDGDSAEVFKFFDKAIMLWKQSDRKSTH